MRPPTEGHDAARRYKISPYLSIPLLTSIALLQSTWLSGVSLWGARPDLMLLVVLAWTAIGNTEEGLLWSFIGGFVLDLLSGGALGVQMLALLAVAFLAGQSLGEGLGSPLVRMLLLALLCGIAYHMTLLVALALTGHTVDWGFAVLRVAGPSVLLNTLLIPFVWQPLTWLMRRMRGERFAL